ncbi:hypothetical protein BC833DRAFT_610992 [Globomyces pollinis-pini]|nr:hypothetical protein BC833DRAFT_610992 [Globomyces pollinis-pini]
MYFLNFLMSLNNVNGFGTQLVQNYVLDGAAWTQTVGCVLVIYAYLISNKKTLFKVLLWQGVSGLIGGLLENIYLAKRVCCSSENWSLLLLVNEANWIVYETSTVVYIMMKLQSVLSHIGVKRILNSTLVILLLLYSIARFNIGRIRFMENNLHSSKIITAQSYAFIVWGFVYLTLFALLIKNAIAIAKQINDRRDGIKTILKSSLPRLTIIVLNTLLIVIFGQLITYLNPPIQRITDTNSLLMAIKSSYPLIILFDIHSTNSLLLMKSTGQGSSQSRSDIPLGTLLRRHSVNPEKEINYVLPVAAKLSYSDLKY